jgi:exopolyphosphatase / guanosine-5'-triphosphate,3'-diphosphate pyrophosphatase
MRLGVLDVGSNTIHLQVMDAHPGARPTPATNFKTELRLIEHLNDSGEISSEGILLLHEAVKGAVEHARESKTEEILAFATSAIRDAKNGTEIIKNINLEFDIDLQIMSGDEEARMTFLAARRWLGWSAGRLLVVDIGGGSLEIAIGDDEHPDATISLPLGAARLTRDFLKGDPYSPKSIRNLEIYVDEVLQDSLPYEIKLHSADHFVATSKTFRTLARIAANGENAKRLQTKSLVNLIPKLGEMSNKERSELSGVSSSRASQILAGSVVARAILEKLQVPEVEICPWALREGLVLRWLDWMER